MSSPPILDLGIVGGAAGSLHPLLHQAGTAAEGLEDPPMGRIATLRGDGERAFGIAGAEPLLASNVIELETPQLRRSGPLDRAPTNPRARINPRAVALAVRVSDALV